MRFALTAWAVTRLLILGAFVAAKPQHGILAAFGNWDGGWYRDIVVTKGYQFVADGKAHDIAFFPLFPLLSSALAHIGISWPLAGVIVNNAAFLAAVLVLYRYVRATFDVSTARWSVAIACALPLSLFCSVAYSEGLFILFSVMALAWYRDERYLAAGLAAAAASATRPLGVALALALIAAAVFERKKVGDVLKCATGLLGIAAFALFCYMRFGDALAFVHAVVGWRHQSGFDLHGWQALREGANEGGTHAWITLVFLMLVVPCVVMYRERIGVAGVSFVALCLVVIAFAGTPISVDRYLYATAPLLIALGRLFARVPIAGYLAVATSLPLLFLDAVAFAQFHWVA
jgi:hypothetical protein